MIIWDNLRNLREISGGKILFPSGGIRAKNEKYPIKNVCLDCLRSKEEREKLLKGTGVPEAVDTDLSNIQQEYNNTVLPFMRSHPELWDPEHHTLELYQSLVAFVMAYRWAVDKAAYITWHVVGL